MENFTSIRIQTLDYPARSKFLNQLCCPERHTIICKPQKCINIFTTVLTSLKIMYLTYSMQPSPSWEANQFSAITKFPAFYGTWKFITAFTIAHHLSLSWTTSIQSMPPHPTSWSSILILSSHLCLNLPSGLFPSGFPIRILYTPLLSPTYATCPAHLIFFYLITQTILGEEYRSLISSLCSFLHSPITSSLLGPNILLSTLFFNTLSQHTSLNVSDQVACPHKTTGKIMVLHTLIFIFLDSKLEDKRFCTKWQQAFHDFNMLLISSSIEFWFY